MIKKFNDYIKENLTDKMVGKSEEEIRKSFKDKGIIFGDILEEKQFVSGSKYWTIDWVEYKGKRYSVGDNVFVDYEDEWDDESEGNDYRGTIDWMMIGYDGRVEVSISDIPLGRVGIEDISHF